MRIKFLRKGEQRKFLQKVLINTRCLSLKSFEQFGFDVSYSTMNNYFSEQRLLPKELFDNLCYIAKIESSKMKFNVVNDNWGQVKGGKVGKRK